ncbi:hypothetical protein KJM25_003233 [Salmonella enterica]|nr:hypothetical protein [Salmonella enterica]
MNALTVAQSYLLLIGSIVLAVFIVQLPLLIKDYLRKRRQRNRLNIEWKEVHITAYGNVKRSDYQKIATGNYEAQTMNDINSRMTISARIQQVIGELHAARLNLTNSDYAEAYKNLTCADKETKLIKRRFRELFRSPKP